MNAAVIAGCVIMAVPFAWMLFGSLKPTSELYSVPPTFIPTVWRPENYAALLERVPFAQYVFNSFEIAILVVVGQLISCSLAAFAFARLRFKGRDVLFVLLLAAIMVPAQVLVIPQFVLFRQLGWLNTHLPLIVPGFFGGAFGIFLLRQYFMTIPQELDDAARLDGASALRIYWHICLPLSKPALAALAVFIFMGNWNDLLGPVIYLTDYAKMTLTVGLAYLQGQYVTDWSVVLAGGVVSVVPILLIFIIAQRHFVEGMVISGLRR